MNSTAWISPPPSQPEFWTYVQADAAAIPFADRYFDLAVSIGVLEHIRPVEKLCAVIAEIARVSNSFIVIVPSLSTPLEPHTAGPFWQLRDTRSKRAYPRLHYFSDEAWLQFGGFEGAEVRRFWYLPPLIANTMIYRRG